MCRMCVALRCRFDCTCSPDCQYLPASPGSPNGQFYVGGEIQIEDDGKAYSGYGTYIGGWNNGRLIDLGMQNTH